MFGFESTRMKQSHINSMKRAGQGRVLGLVDLIKMFTLQYDRALADAPHAAGNLISLGYDSQLTFARCQKKVLVHWIPDTTKLRQQQLPTRKGRRACQDA